MRSCKYRRMLRPHTRATTHPSPRVTLLNQLAAKGPVLLFIRLSCGQGSRLTILPDYEIGNQVMSGHHMRKSGQTRRQ